jgi:acyl transferase domain-containing protein
MELPPSVASADDLWSAFMQGKKAISSPPQPFAEHCNQPSGYLVPPFDMVRASAIAKDHGLDSVEAAVLDPQHALAIELTERALRDAGDQCRALALADRERVGVYIGAWQAPADDAGRKSAYSAIGSSLSALASRVANCFDLQGPAITINTACSSSLVAVDFAMRDMRAGRIDYALVGGVNLIASSAKAAETFAALKRATMLSPTSACHTFSAAADGCAQPLSPSSIGSHSPSLTPAAPSETYACPRLCASSPPPPPFHPVIPQLCAI